MSKKSPLIFLGVIKKFAEYCFCLTVTLVTVVTYLNFCELDGVGGSFFPLTEGDFTSYSANYSDSKFKSIQKGMEVALVNEIMGAPIQEFRTQTGARYFSYSQTRDGRGASYRKRLIFFDNKNRVSEIRSEFYPE